MKHAVPHSLGKTQAISVAKKAFDSYVARFSQYGAQVNWTAEDRANIAFNVKGVSIKGAVAVDDKDIQIDMDVPFLLRPFKDMALGKVEEEIKGWIAKAERGELK